MVALCISRSPPTTWTERGSSTSRRSGGTSPSFPEMEYTTAKTTPSDDQGRPTEPGSINGGMFQREDPLTTPVITVDVDDIDKALETVSSLGGSMVRPRQAVADMGFAAYFKDSEGNLIGLWQNA